MVRALFFALCLLASAAMAGPAEETNCAGASYWARMAAGADSADASKYAVAYCSCLANKLGTRSWTSVTAAELKACSTRAKK